MYPAPKRPPKRVGGAPFASPKKAQSMSARSAASKPTGSTPQAPNSARVPSSRAADTNSVAAAAIRAESYYDNLLGRAKAGAEVVDTRQDWTLVQEIDALDHFNAEEKKKQTIRERNVKNQAAIQEQLQARRNVSDKCRDVWKQWRTELEDDVEQFQKEEQMKRVFKKETQAAFNKERQAQLDVKKQRQATQKELEVKMEEEMMNMATQAKQRQDELDSKRKENQKNSMLLMKTEADKALERKQHARQEEYKMDIKMQEQYEALLEEQERKRGSYFEGLREKQAGMLAKYEAGVGNELARLQALDDERAKKHWDAKQLKDKRDHEARAQWKNDLAESGRVAVQNQLSLQAQERQKRKDEDQRYLDKANREAAISQAKEDEKNRKQREAVQANAEFIKQQIAEKEKQSPSRRIQLSQMSENERRINREKLERATDPNRSDGLQLLLAKKEEDYRKMRRGGPIAMPS